MGAFTPVKKHAKRFNYTPRYYDPVKEALEQRRSELYGHRRSDASTTESGEYVPGDYIRNKRAARTLGRGDKGTTKRKSLIISIIFMSMVLIVGWMMSQRFVDLFFMATTTSEQSAVQEYEEFDPYAPITVVPNDYDPSKDVAK
ncbi:MAG: hypothetical protein SNH63_00820 [Rikenellaceae bacterium]